MNLVEQLRAIANNKQNLKVATPAQEEQPAPEKLPENRPRPDRVTIPAEALDFLEGFDGLPHVGGKFAGKNHVVFDFEVFAKYWLCVALVMETKQIYYFDTCEDLTKFYNQHKTDVWIGYNNKNYDNYIIKFAILGATCLSIKRLNDYLTSGSVDGRLIDSDSNGRGWRYIDAVGRQNPEFRRRFDAIDFINFDIMSAFKGFHSLKELEGYAGHSIIETSIPFDYSGELTDDEKAEVKYYCANDVIFTAYITKKRFNRVTAFEKLVDRYNLPLTDLSSTEAGISAKILKAKYKKRNDTYDLDFPDFATCDYCETLKRWFADPKNHTDDEKKQIKLTIDGVECNYGFGGAHAARKKYYGHGEFYHIDVNSYYPSTMVNFGLLSRNVPDPKVFEDILKARLEAKQAGDKITSEALKIVLNGTYGASKTHYVNPLLDPRQQLEVSIYGQLLITQLASMLEGKCKLIQINTDALDIQITNTPINELEPIIKSWESATGLSLDRKLYTAIAQNNVNNYVVKYADGSIEGKGAAAKQKSEFDNDLPIVNKAVKLALLEDIPIEETILSATDLIDFQKIVKVTGAFSKSCHNGADLPNRVNRVFASTRFTDGPVKNVKIVNGIAKLQKIAFVPENCFINNGDIRGAGIPEHLNRQWYIDLATSLYKQFRTTAATEENTLFPDVSAED